MNIQYLKKEVNSFIKFILLLLLIIIAYNTTNSFIFKTSDYSSVNLFLFDIPFIILISSMLYFPRIKNTFVKNILPSIPFILIYIGFDIFYSFLARTPRISDFENISLIYNIYPLGFFIPIIIVLILYIIFFSAYTTYNRKIFFKHIFLRFIFIATCILLIQSESFIKYHKNIFHHIIWSDNLTINHNGRISSFIFYSNLDKNNNIKLKKHNNNINIIDNLFTDKIEHPRNIYFIILESFLNPNYLQKINFNQNPLAKELLGYLYKKDFSTLISPVYGGSTAQAEFELLTGIKAFSKINAIEFNVLKGGEIKSFLYQLKHNNYTTMATIATDSSYFNSKLAYKSLGFEYIRFLEEETDFIKNKNDTVIFDKDLFDYNFKLIKTHLKNSKKPIFSYVLGVYGHYPYRRNKIQRPDIIQIKNNSNTKLHDISNQFYYRTLALANYIKNIISIDPNSLIVMSSDHLPAILNSNIQYKYNKYTNIALLINDNKAINITRKAQYEIPWMVWNILSKNNTKRKISIKTLEEIYFKALYQGLNNKNK